MTMDFVMGLGREALETVLAVSLPVLGMSLAVGLVVSLFQAVTQIQEMTLTFVPKIIITFVSLLLFGSWMMGQMIHFTQRILQNFPMWIR